MWNERFEMLENPVSTKMYYPSDEAVPKRACQQLIDVYKKMHEVENRKTAAKNKKIEECLREIDDIKK